MHERVQKDYRSLKRQAVIHEKTVRQEERNQIAREIHDSVGHRLTALLMQLEVVRLQTTDVSDRETITHLKSLAQVSLTETREAVRALKSEETTGLTAVIQLIRKLEAESHLQIAFQIKAGAFSFPLTSKQSIVLYRSVQEGLTNMMRHSASREAEVEFRVVGGSFFRFRITNPLNKKIEIVEGFGLTAMRERLEELGGTLSINQAEGEFALTGTFPMEKGED
jgi:signal transduction histidine kinase